MRIARFSNGAADRVGVVVGNDIASVTFASTTIDLIAQWDALRSEIEAPACLPPGPHKSQRGDPLLNRTA